eukprot:4420239-Lingulodinium_polyedra.AAC.1
MPSLTRDCIAEHAPASSTLVLAGDCARVRIAASAFLSLCLPELAALPWLASALQPFSQTINH